MDHFNIGEDNFVEFLIRYGKLDSECWILDFASVPIL